MSHNVHSLFHLGDDSRKYGSLNNSSFPFESFMQPIKKKVRSGMKPLHQLVNRFAEHRINHMSSQRNQNIHSSGPINAHCTFKVRPLTSNACTPQYTGWKTDKFSIKINDSCIEMKNGSFVLIENIATSKTNENNILIIGRFFKKVKDFFTTPCSSRLLNIYEVCQLSGLQSWPLKDVEKKLVRLPLNLDKTVIIPFVHDY